MVQTQNQTEEGTAPQRKFFHGIARKFILRILLISIAITLLFACLHVYFEYTQAIEKVDESFANIHSTHLQTITESVWVADTKLLDVQLQGIAGYPHIQYLELETKDLGPISLGIQKSRYVRQQKFPLVYTYRNESIELGSLLVVMDLEYLFRDLVMDAILIGITEAVKIFLYASFIFYLFYSLVGRHLRDMAAYTKVFNFQEPGPPLTLRRAASADEAGDELAQLVVAINQMQQNIRDDFERRILIEQQLHESERHYRELVESTGDLITSVDAQGNFVLVNHMAEEILGYGAEHIVGMSAFQFVHPDDREKTIHWFEACVQQHKRQDAIENRQVNCRTQQVHHMLWTCNFHYDAEGRLLHLSGIAHDITERIQNEESLLRIKKLEATGVMAGGIAHDFNNLLAIIKGYAELARDAAPKSSATLHEMLDQINEASERATDLTRKFLTYSAGGIPAKKVCSLRGILQNTAAALLQGSYSYELAAPADIANVDCDESQLTLAFSNIFTNAKESMPDGGVVRIQVDNTASDEVEKKTGQACQQDRYVAIAIADQGCGIRESDLPQIFDPYFSTKDRGAHKGMGLGLSIASSIIHKHNGSILVQSQPQSGTEFLVFLPAVDAPAAAVSFDQPVCFSSGDDPAVGTASILVMDDEEMLREMMKCQLVSSGYAVTTVRNGEEVIAQYSAPERGKRPFDLVILDLTVKGGMGGMDTLAALQKIDPAVKAVACSGYSEDPVIANCTEHGFVGALSKPFSKKALAELVARVLAA